MQSATIIKLGTNNSVTGVATFEEAFGEFSEARGRGRQRRAERKADRIEKRKEKKLAKISARDEVKSARKEARRGRKSDKISARGERRAMRGELKDEAMERRQSRKDYRINKRLERKEMGREDEPLEDELEDEAKMQEQDQYENDEPRESENEGIGEGQGEYETGGGGSYDEDYVEEEEGDSIGEDDDMYSQEEEEQNDEEYGFDGVMGAEDRFSELANAEIKISPKADDLSTKVEWNKELLSRLRVAKSKAIGVGNSEDANALQNQIESTLDRINELETQVSKYINFEGEYLNADGKQPSKFAKDRRFKEMMTAKKRAYGKRLAIGKNRVNNTPVEARLKPQFSKQRIVVPASENLSSYTGINGLDNLDDLDAPAIREIKLGVDGGKTTEINWKGIAIGVGVGLLGIWAIRKYKLI